MSQRIMVTEKRRSWFIFSWYEKISEQKVGNDLFIHTDRAIDKIYLNGKEIQ